MPAEFVDGEGHVEARVEAVRAAFPAHTEAKYDESRSWFDTFDWRLHDAGLLLERRTRADQDWLVLSDLDGRRLARTPADAEVSVDTLPPGPLRDRVVAAVDIRALLRRATLSGPGTVLSVLDDEEKTVARIAVDGPLVAGDEDLGVRVRVEPLRGYGKEARRVGSRLATMPGLVPADGPLFRDAFRACRVVPGDYRAKPDTVLDPETATEDAFAVIFGQLLGILRANLDGTLQELDTEFLHDLRVTVRRTRSLLKVADGVLPDDVRTTCAAELKWLGDATSTPRDLDVYLLGFDKMVAEEPEPDALQPFLSALTKHCRRAHASLNRTLRSKRFADLLTRWERDLAQVDESRERSAGPVGAAADARLAKAWRRVEKRGGAITEASPAEALHDLRKKCKELRYLLEFFAGLYNKGAHKEMVSELKQLQDNLGEFQDAEAQRHLVLEYAEELAGSGAPTATLLAMGRLEEHLERRQAAARDQFAERWQRFDRPHNQRLLSSLVAR